MSEKKKIWSFSRAEKADALPESSLPTLGYFFKLLWRKLGRLVTLNLMMVVRFLPLVAILLIYLFGRQTVTVENPVFTPLLGVKLAGGSPVSVALIGIFGTQQSAAYPTTAATVIMLLLLAFTVLTWGWQTVGATYNLRSLVRGDSCFIWSDYFYAIKRNWRQGLIFGLIDALAIAVLIFDWYYFNTLAGASFAFSLMYFVTLALILIYASMRFYVYPMMITFDLPIKKLIKNAFIFSMLGVKRNLMAIFGFVLVAGINIALILPSLSIGFTLTLILPFFYLPAFGGFMSMYAAYPNIRRYMIDGRTELSTYTDGAYADEEPEEEPEQDDLTPTPPAAG
ncbi:MAG: hypothetical protein J6U87_05075 [Clostridia bacterium]|nr:hypothetical protein [Clostridia bacterium]